MAIRTRRQSGMSGALPESAGSFTLSSALEEANRCLWSSGPYLGSHDPGWNRSKLKEIATSTLMQQLVG